MTTIDDTGRRALVRLGVDPGVTRTYVVRVEIVDGEIVSAREVPIWRPSGATAEPLTERKGRR